jgi:hypothetical protein
MASTAQPSTTDAAKAAWWRWATLLGLWFGFAALIILAAHNNRDYGFAVFTVYENAAEAVLNDQSPYDGGTAVSAWPYLYPPLLAQIIVPLIAATDHPTAALIFFALNMALLAAAAAVLSRQATPTQRRDIWLLAVFLLPIGQAIFLGQITVVMLALLAGTWAAVRDHRPGLGGALLALACWIKVYPALIVLYFVWKRDWRVVRGVAIAGIVLAALQVIISGVDIVPDFLSVLTDLAAVGQPELNFESLSILAFASRLFEANVRVHPLIISEDLFAVTRWGLTLGIAAVTFWAARPSLQRRAPVPRRGLRFDLEFGLMVCAALLLGSTLWVSGLPPLLLVYVVILRRRDQPDAPTWLDPALLAAVVLVMLALPVVLVGSAITLHALILSAGFFGVVITWGLCAALLLRRDDIIDSVDNGFSGA